MVLVALVTGQPTSGTSNSELSQATDSGEYSGVTVEIVPAPTVQDVLLSVCEMNGYGQECAQTLLGMLWNESSNVFDAVGDHGAARGYFQIHYTLHNITTACAEDLVCSANWTIQYLERNGYPDYVNYAVQCHNGCNATNGYAARAARNGKRLWNQPLEINQEAPIDLTQLEPIQLAMVE